MTRLTRRLSATTATTSRVYVRVRGEGCAAKGESVAYQHFQSRVGIVAWVSELSVGSSSSMQRRGGGGGGDGGDGGFGGGGEGGG